MSKPQADIAGIDGDVLRYELGAVAMAKEELFDITVERPWPDVDVYELVDKRITEIIQAVGANAYEVYLTGPGNYRNNVATIKPYKGNRTGLEKPYHWETVSRRLKDKWGAITVNGIEADDWLALRGTEEGSRYAICSRDKDLRQVPECVHYSWACGENQPAVGPFVVDGIGKVWADFKLYGVKQQKAWKLHGNGIAFFYGQLLVGDSVDNIPGCPKVGPKKASDLLGHLASEAELYRACAYEYHRVYGDGWKEALVENARLLHLLRSRDTMDIEVSGQELNCVVNKLWETPDGTKIDFFGSSNADGGRVHETLEDGLRLSL